MSRWIKVFILSMLVSGCDEDRSLSPPADSKMLKLVFVLPKDFKPLPLLVIYRSSICKQTRGNAKGDAYEIPGFSSLKLNGVGSDLVEYDIFFDGGGECHWALSNVTVNFEYAGILSYQADEVISDSTRFVFDDNPPQVTNGRFTLVKGNGEVSDNYYPLLRAGKVGISKRVLSFWRRNENSFYKVKEVDHLIYKPIVHTALLVKAVQPEVMGLGHYYKIIYPDGSVAYEPNFPNFDKLERLAAAK